MDEKKDSKGHEDKQGAVRDTELLINGYGSPVSRDFFLVRKGEKVATALYLLTEHFDTDEPLRMRLRTCGLEFLKDMNQFSARPSVQAQVMVIASLTEALTLLEIARLSKMVSEGNHAILKRELESLSEMLGSISVLPPERTLFPEGLFSVADEPTPLRQSKPVYKGHKNKSVLYDRNTPLLSKDERPAVPKGSKAPRNGERRVTILSLIEKNKLASIKDIHGSFSGVSEKTIQRDLTKMVREGVLERRGDKRWSRYCRKGAKDPAA